MIKKNKWGRIITALAVMTAVVAVDQGLKRLMYVWLQPKGTYPLIEGFIHFCYATNKGAAFGIFSDQRWVFLTVSAVAIVFMLALLAIYGKRSLLLSISLALLAGGGIGNMVDRIFRGYVIDFIEFQFVPFAIFNFADTCVCVGSGLLIIYILFFELTRQKPPELNGSKTTVSQDAMAPGGKPETDARPERGDG